jgi:hypothetical protein
VFETSKTNESVVGVIFKRTTQFVVLALLLIGASSAYRAYIQVRSLELTLNEPLLHPGSTIRIDALGSGRTHVTVQLELIQGAHSETIDSFVVPGNEWGFFDQRTQARSNTVKLDAERLSSFQPGAALLRATATGREQWTRLPPPTVRELHVKIQHD